MSLQKELKGREVLGCNRISDGMKYDVDKDSKMFGKEYYRYAIDGAVFVVETQSPFVKDHQDGNIYSLKFGINDKEQLSLINYTTLEGEFKMAEFEAKLEGLKTISSRPAVAVTDEQLAGLD